MVARVCSTANLNQKGTGESVTIKEKQKGKITMIIRSNKNKNYTAMCNVHLRDANLSLKAKGLLSVILSLPDDWEYSLDGLAKICKEGKNAVKTALAELKEYGYLVITKLPPSRDNGGKFEYVYDVYEIPQPIEAQSIEAQDIEAQDVDIQDVDIQGIENLPIENQAIEVQAIENLPQLNKDILNTKKQNTERLSKDKLNISSETINRSKQEEIKITLPLNDKTEQQITKSQIEEWKELYPAVDIMQELRNMRGWLISNPTKRKTKQGINRFINSWLCKKQDKGGISDARSYTGKEYIRASITERGEKEAKRSYAKHCF